MNCLHRRRRVPVASSRCEVQTGPCPACCSFHTRAYLRADRSVMFRGCLTCNHTWDDDRGADARCVDGSLVTPREWWQQR